MLVNGIHHITAVSSSAQATYDFYTKVLGLRLVKKSVNQDDVQTYHLFFGNKTGGPGMDITFFPFAHAPAGIRGSGLVTTISFAVRTRSLTFWKKRFEDLHVKHEHITEVFGYQRFIFYDEDDQRLELVEVAEIEENYVKNVWETKEIAKEYALYSFHSATLDVVTLDSIRPVLDLFGYELISQNGGSYLFKLPSKASSAELTVEEKPSMEQSLNGFGTVHHIAFSVADRKAQDQLRRKLVEIGEQPTHTIDRFYFASVYFRTSSGILFEIATVEPGFTADEDEASLGEHLALPPFLEPQRGQIEAGLLPIKTNSS